VLSGQGIINMTNSELISKLKQAQDLLSDVYHWACEEQESKLLKNSEVANQMSCADSCIIEALDALEWNIDE
jgi:hypothetical protein